MANVAAALIALLGVIVAGYLSTFVAEDYRRFKDGSGLAAALSGELASYMLALDTVRPVLEGLRRAAEVNGNLLLPRADSQTDPVFAANVQRLGLLGAELAEDTAFIYQQIHAFRTSYKLLSGDNLWMNKAQVLDVVGSWQATVERAQQRGTLLLPKLKSRANASYRPWPLSAST